MAKQILTQKSSDRPYFHRDFHIVLNDAIVYLHERFGESAVREYLTQFAAAWYAPLKKSLQERGLVALQEHYKRIYTLEGAAYDMTLSADKLTIRLFSSPAVEHIKSNRQTISPLFQETVETVNREICRGTPFSSALLDYSTENGGYTLQFLRRKP